MAEHIHYISSKEWEQAVLEGDKVVVDFYSTECPPCEALAAKYEPLSELYGRDVRFIKIFRQENRPLAEQLGIKSSPTVLFFNRGKQVGDFLTGAIKRSELVRNLDSLIAPERAAEIHGRMKASTTKVDVLILGGGPAGLTAAIYAAQAKADTLLVDTALPGGQVSTTHQVSNYPGFDKPVQGFMLMHTMSEQARNAGTRFKSAVDITEVDLKNRRIVVDELETIEAKRIIIATGASPKKLNVPGEMEFKGRGLSYCSTCDAKYFDGKEVVVIGGGNTAVEESLFIAKFASKVTVVHRSPELKAQRSILEEAQKQPRISFLPSYEPHAFIRNSNHTMSTRFASKADGTSLTLQSDGVFIFAGMRPNLDGFGRQLATDDYGYIRVNREMRTSVPDVYAAGDVAEKSCRQITVATSEGTIAAVNAVKGL